MVTLRAAYHTLPTSVSIVTDDKKERHQSKNQTNKQRFGKGIPVQWGVAYYNYLIAGNCILSPSSGHTHGSIPYHTIPASQL